MSAGSGAPRTMTARRARVASLIASRPVSSQDELRRLLADEGITVTQATLSRDLDALGATKEPAGNGATVYAVDDVSATDTSIPAPASDAAFTRVTAELLLRAESAGNIAVLHTPPGAAQFYAGYMDRSDRFESIGTVAGDDTIIIVMRTASAARALCRTLLSLAERGAQ